MDDPTVIDPQPTRPGGAGGPVMAEGTDTGGANPTRGTSAGDRIVGGPDQGATVAFGSTLTPVGGDAGATDPGGLTVADSATPPLSRRAAPTVPGYEVLHELGRGGMGVVYLVRQVRLNRACALKMILAGEQASTESAARFLAEAEAVARLHHPNIVQIHATGEAGGLPYFELEYVPGGSLDRKLDGTPWPGRRAAALVEGLARGVAAAHGLGIVHRDLKPANVLLGEDEAPKITDFGLAKAMHADSGLTEPESVMGTPAYMAPEQAEGQAHGAGPAVDIFSLGGILYELLTGRPPFRGASLLETLELVKNSEPVPPVRLVPKLPRDVETICLKCLQKAPQKRYASAAALAEDLRRWRAGEPIAARPVGRAERTWSWCRRKPALATWIGLAAGLTIAIAVISTVAAVWLKQQRDVARRITAALHVEQDKLRVQRRKALDAEAVARSERDRANRHLYISNMRLAQQIWDRDDGPARAVDELLAAHIPRSTDEADLRDFSWRLLWTRLHRSAATFDGPTAPVDGTLGTDGRVTALDDRGILRRWDPVADRIVEEHDYGGGSPPRRRALSADGTTVANVEADGATLRLFDAQDGRKRRAIEGPATIDRIAFAPEGRLLASLGSDRTVRVYEVATGKERGSVRLRPGPYRCLALTPDGQTVFLGNHPALGRVTAYHLATGAATPLTDQGATVPAVACSPDGRQIAVGNAFGRVTVWDSATRQPLGPPLQVHAGGVRRLAFSADSRRLASGDVNGLLIVWDIAGQRPLARLKGHTSPIALLAFAPEADALVSGATDGVLKVWDLKSPDGVRTLEATDTSASRLVFTQDGRQLATAGRTIGLWDVRTRAPIRIFGGDGPEPDKLPQLTCLALTPDGTRMATGGHGARVVLWEVATGRALRTFDGMPPEFYGPPSPLFALGTPRSKRMVGAVAFSPDGTLLAAGYGNRTGFIGDYRQVVHVWDVRTGHEARVLHVANTVSMLQFATDSSTLWAACHDGTLPSWKVGNWEPAGTLRAEQPIASAAVSPDETLLAAGLNNGMIVLWERATGREVRRVSGHPGGIPAMAFTPDGRTLATSSGSDRALRFWDVGTGSEISNLRTHGRLLGLAFAPGGDLLATGEPDGVRLWPAAPLEQIDVTSGRPAGPSARHSPVGAHPAGPRPLWPAPPEQRRSSRRRPRPRPPRRLDDGVAEVEFAAQPGGADPAVDRHPVAAPDMIAYNEALGGEDRDRGVLGSSVGPPARYRGAPSTGRPAGGADGDRGSGRTLPDRAVRRRGRGPRARSMTPDVPCRDRSRQERDASGRIPGLSAGEGLARRGGGGRGGGHCGADLVREEPGAR